jgi:hypothetical protein
MAMTKGKMGNNKKLMAFNSGRNSGVRMFLTAIGKKCGVPQIDGA